jgi:hypothetical protein
MKKCTWKDKAVTRLKAGGSKKRGPNKLSYAGEVAASDLLPLDHMLSVMRDPNASTKLRMAMAAKALPYCHPRLKSVEPPRPAPNVPTEVKIQVVNPDSSPYRPAGTAGDSEDNETPLVARNRRSAF